MRPYCAVAGPLELVAAEAGTGSGAAPAAGPDEASPARSSVFFFMRSINSFFRLDCICFLERGFFCCWVGPPGEKAGALALCSSTVVLACLAGGSSLACPGSSCYIDLSEEEEEPHARLSSACFYDHMWSAEAVIIPAVGSLLAYSNDTASLNGTCS